MPAGSTADSSSSSSSDSDSSIESASVSPSTAALPRQIKQVHVPMASSQTSLAAMFFPPERPLQHLKDHSTSQSAGEVAAQQQQQEKMLWTQAQAARSGQPYQAGTAAGPPQFAQQHDAQISRSSARPAEPSVHGAASLIADATASASIIATANGSSDRPAPAGKGVRSKAGTGRPAQSTKPTEAPQQNGRSFSSPAPALTKGKAHAVPPADLPGAATTDGLSAQGHAAVEPRKAGPVLPPPTAAERRRTAAAATKDKRRLEIKAAGRKAEAEAAQHRAEAEAAQHRAEAEAARQKADAAAATAARETAKLEAHQNQAKERLTAEAAAEQAKQRYAEATRLANEDAAAEACRRAVDAMQSSSFDQAARLLKKARGLEGEPLKLKVSGLTRKLYEEKDRAAAAAAMARERERVEQREKARQEEMQRQQAEQERQRRMEQQKQRQEQERQQAARDKQEADRAAAQKEEKQRAYEATGIPDAMPKSGWGMMKHFLYCAFLFGVACVSLVLPVLLRLSGWHSGCRYLRAMLNKPGLSCRLAQLGSLITALLMLAAACALMWGSVRLCRALLGSTVSACFQIVWTVFNMLVWQPVWWATLPMAAVMAFQRRYRAGNYLYIFPVIWWLARGRWWSLFSMPVVLLVGLTFREILSSSIAYVLLANSFTAISSWWWSTLWACALVAGFVVWLGLTADGDGKGKSRPGRKPGRAHPRSRGIGNMDPGQQSVKGASGEIARVLAAEDLWEVLQIPKQTPADVLRKAKNMKLLLVHPDKLPPKTPGAPEAFQRVTQAYEVLSNPQQCKQYVEELRLEEQEDEDYERSQSATAAGTPYPDPDSYPEPFAREEHLSYPCWGPSGQPHTHTLKITARPRLKARFCRSCRAMHAAKEGEGWLETDGFFHRCKAYACVGSRIIDITDMAHCKGWVYDPDGRLYDADTHEATMLIGATSPHASYGHYAPLNHNRNKQKRGRNRRR